MLLCGAFKEPVMKHCNHSSHPPPSHVTPQDALSGIPSSRNVQSWHRELHPDPDPMPSSISYCSQNHLRTSPWGRQCLPTLLGFLEPCEKRPAPDPALPGGLLNAQQALAGKKALTLYTGSPTIPSRGTGELLPLLTLWHQVSLAQIHIFLVLTTVTVPSRVRMCCFTGKMQRLSLHCVYNKWIGAGLQTKADVCEDLTDTFQGSLFQTRSTSPRTSIL